MKRTTTSTTLACILAVTFLLTGCLGLETTESQDYAIKKLSRIAGITLALEKPEEIDKALSYIEYMKGIEDGNLKDAALAVAIEYVYKTYGKTNKTVILMAEVVDLVRMVMPTDVVPGTTPEFDMRLLNIALAGFEEGLILAR